MLSNGTATLGVSTLSAAKHSLIAIYGGDSNDATSASSVLSQTVLTKTIITLVSTANPAAYGQSVTFTSTVFPRRYWHRYVL